MASLILTQVSMFGGTLGLTKGLFLIFFKIMEPGYRVLVGLGEVTIFDRIPLMQYLCQLIFKQKKPWLLYHGKNSCYFLTL